MLDAVIIVLALLAMGIGSLTDLRTREVPDWVNYGLLAAAIAVRLIFAVVESDLSIILEGFYGFAIFFSLGLALFYLGQFGGGDAKMLMGLGVLIGFFPSADSLLLRFTIGILFMGAIYGMIWSLGLAWKNKDAFKRRWLKSVKTKEVRWLKTGLLVFAIAIIILSFILNDSQLTITLLVLTIAIIVTFYLWLFVRTVEHSVMIKKVGPEVLTEGDWIAEEVRIGKKYICGPKDLGISKEQIAQLIALKKKKKLKTVVLKEGIPFVPSFLLGFIVALLSYQFFF